MVRRKGEITDKHRRRAFPHDVEIALPSSGLRQELDRMTRWCAEQVGPDGFATTSRLDRELGRDFVQFRFKECTHADAFRKAFRLPQRTSDEAEVWQAAALMVKLYGAAAADEADKRAALLLSRNEHAGYSTYRLIWEAIRQLQRGRGPDERAN